MTVRPVDLVEQALAEHGCNPRRGAARCPAHPDTNPSLSYSEADNGNALIHCHAGCTPDSILTALGLTPTDLFPPKTGNGHQPTPDLRNLIRTITATYTYTTASGTPLYQVVRYHPKAFRQRLPDGTWGIGDTPRIAYNLPAVKAAIANRQPIWIVEGEKDVDLLTRLGHTGTCNSGGAGQWNDLCTKALNGAQHVTIVADNDEPGRRHATNIAAAIAGTVHHLELRLPAAGKDLTDHIAAGLTLDQLAPWQPDNDNLPTPVDWPAFWAEDHEPEEWLCRPYLPLGRQIAMFAPAKTGKSLLALEVAVKLAVGQAVFWQPAAPPVDTVYIDLEMTAADLYERLEAIGISEDDDLTHFHYYLLPQLPPLDTAEGGAVVAAIAARHNARLVVIDTMARVVEGGENDADTYRAFYRHTGRALKAAHVTLLRLDHAGKDPGKGQRGSSEKAGDVDIVWQLGIPEPGVVHLKATHKRVGWVPDLIELTRQNEPWLSHTIAAPDVTYEAGTRKIIDALDQAGVPIAASSREACRMLKAAGAPHRRERVVKALRARKEAVDNLPPVEHMCGSQNAEPRTVSGKPEGSGTTFAKPPLTSTGTTPEPPEPPERPERVVSPPLGGEPPPGTAGIGSTYPQIGPDDPESSLF